MKSTIGKKIMEERYKRIKERVKEETEKTNSEMCICPDAMAECFEANPKGHYVNCPCWGTNHPNRNLHI